MSLEKNLILALEKVSESIMKCKLEVINEQNLGLGLNYYVYLDRIRKLGFPSFGELAEKLNVSKPAITAVVNKLIKLGYVEKVQSAEDKRVFCVQLTETGMTISDTLLKAHERFIKQVKSSMDEEELKTLVSLINKLP